MGITNFPNGISSFGVPMAGPDYASMFGSYWFVDNSSSAARNDGKSPDTPFTTIAAAVAKAAAGDTIYVRGTNTDYDEAVTITANMVSLIGVASHVKMLGWNADSDATCLTITGHGCVVDGFYFRPEGATSGIAIDIGTDTTTAKGDCTVIRNNLFKSSAVTCAYAIKANGCPEYVKIYNNHFTWCGYGIYCGATPIKPATGWEIIGNIFSDKCTNGIDLPARRCLVSENFFNAMTIHLDLLGYGSSGTFNSVARNHFGGDYSTSSDSYVAGTSDVWTGNWATDVDEDEVEAVSGTTSVVPAA